MATQGAANAHRAPFAIQAVLGLKYSVLVACSGLGDKVFHLVRDGSVASICGLPRDALGPASEDTELVCETCIEWLPNRMDASVRLRKSSASELGFIPLISHYGQLFDAGELDKLNQILTSDVTHT